MILNVGGMSEERFKFLCKIIGPRAAARLRDELAGGSKALDGMLTGYKQEALTFAEHDVEETLVVLFGILGNIRISGLTGEQKLDGSLSALAEAQERLSSLAGNEKDVLHHLNATFDDAREQYETAGDGKKAISEAAARRIEGTLTARVGAVVSKDGRPRPARGGLMDLMTPRTKPLAAMWQSLDLTGAAVAKSVPRVGGRRGFGATPARLYQLMSGDADDRARVLSAVKSAATEAGRSKAQIAEAARIYVPELASTKEKARGARQHPAQLYVDDLLRGNRGR